jgi:O-antigen/teichoic acid export membrane protein
MNERRPAPATQPVAAGPFWLRRAGVCAGLAHDPGHAGRRNRSIRLAVLTSLLSKGGMAMLQLVSIPIAIRVLGLEAFGLYATVAMGITIVALFQIGIGPALTHGISRAVANGDTASEKSYYSTSLFLMLAAALAGAAAASAILACVPIPVLFGAQYAAHAETMRPALWLGIGIMLVQFVLTHTERMREGYLEANINNLWGAIGNVIGALAVGIGILFVPTIEFLLLAVYGSNVAGKIGNTVHLLAKRPHLRPRFRRFRENLAKELFTDGIAFSLSGSLTPLVEFNACALIIAHIAGPSAVGIFNILIQIDTILIGLILMFTTPTWPAVVDAFARNDIAWIRATAARLRGFAVSYAALAGAALVILGPLVIPLWLGAEVQIGRPVLLAFALYFLAGIWNHVNHSLLVGVGKVKASAGYTFLEAAIILGPAGLGIALFGMPGLLGGMFLTKALVTGTIFPRMFAKAIDRRAAAPAAAFVEPEKSEAAVAP